MNYNFYRYPTIMVQLKFSPALLAIYSGSDGWLSVWGGVEIIRI